MTIFIRKYLHFMNDSYYFYCNKHESWSQMITRILEQAPRENSYLLQLN